MTFKLTKATSEKMMESMESIIGEAVTMEIRSGEVPEKPYLHPLWGIMMRADFDAADTGDLLSSVEMAGDGRVTFRGVAKVTTAGRASYIRIRDKRGQILIQGIVTDRMGRRADGGYEADAALKMDCIDCQVGQDIEINMTLGVTDA